MATLMRAEAVAALAGRKAERDRILANLLDLDASFGKRLLAGASLTGITKQRWDEAAADLAAVWDIFAAYSAVIERAAEVLEHSRRPGGPELAEAASLLTGPSVLLVGQEVPLERRSLTSSGRPEEHISLDQAAQRMGTGFSRAAEVVSMAESVWNDVSERLEQISSALGPVNHWIAGAAEGELRDKVSVIEAELRRIRELRNSDPLALSQGQRAAVRGLDELLRQARSVATVAAELARLREDAERRIAEVTARVTIAQAREQDARAALGEAAEKIAADQLPPMPATSAGMTERIAALGALRKASRWQRLAAEIAVIEQEAAAAGARWKEAEDAARAVLDRRSELRGLLDAYRAKAGAAGAAEDDQLTHRYRVARDLLWSAPCDLSAAAEAVRGYQDAVLAVGRAKP